MPIVNLDLKRLENWFPGKSVNQIIDALPFIALDIESTTDTEIRIEYNPNRPDFSFRLWDSQSTKGISRYRTWNSQIQSDSNQ